MNSPTRGGDENRKYSGMVHLVYAVKASSVITIGFDVYDKSLPMPSDAELRRLITDEFTKHWNDSGGWAEVDGFELIEIQTET